jgi:hypothetical protein
VLLCWFCAWHGIISFPAYDRVRPPGAGFLIIEEGLNPLKEEKQMTKVKIVVDKMPAEDKDCPFAIKCPGKNEYPCVCDLRREKERNSGVTFSMCQPSNCVLSLGEAGCDLLTVK